MPQFEFFNSPAPFILGIPLAWIGMMYFVSRGGWSRLAERFAATDAPHGRKIRVRSIHCGKSQYKNMVSLWTTERGFYMKSSILFRMWHPTLFIPWHAIAQVEEKQTWGIMKYYRISIGAPPTVITVYGKTFEALRATGQLPMQAPKEAGINGEQHRVL